MVTMYLAFFNASVVLAALTAAAYFLYTFAYYRAAQEAKQQRRRSGKGARARVSARPALAAANASPFSRFTRLLSGYVANQTSHATAAVQRARVGAVAVPIHSEFEVADGALPVSESAAAFGRLGTILAWLLAFTLVMALVIRAAITGHAPWTNMYEASIALAAFLMLAYIYFEIRYKTRTMGVGAAGVALLLLVFAIWVGAAFNQAEPVQFGKIMPALQDNPILTIHVSMMIVSYAFFIVGFICGTIMLVQGDGTKPRYAWLPTAEAADELGYRSVTIGFPLLALGIILGAWWANYAWGHYWSWDPKETSALITWLVYAIYLHARGLRGMRGKTMAWLLVAGFAATLFTYFGVSFLVPGLHSYAGVK